VILEQGAESNDEPEKEETDNTSFDRVGDLHREMIENHQVEPQRRDHAEYGFDHAQTPAQNGSKTLHHRLPLKRKSKSPQRGQRQHGTQRKWRFR